MSKRPRVLIHFPMASFDLLFLDGVYWVYVYSHVAPRRDALVYIRTSHLHLTCELVLIPRPPFASSDPAPWRRTCFLDAEADAPDGSPL